MKMSSPAPLEYRTETTQLEHTVTTVTTEIDSQPALLSQKHVPHVQSPSPTCGESRDIKSRQSQVTLSADVVDNGQQDGTADMRQYEVRLATYKHWNVPFLKPERMANSGFYYLNRGDEVRCAFCKVEIMRWEPGDDPEADHRKWAPQCPFLRTQPSGSSSPSSSAADGRDECGSQVTSVKNWGPANPQYATVTSRLASFKHWPLSLRQKPKDLSEAGFFYTGQGDQTKCFYCDGGLKDWEDDDIPWEQHARWFDRCAYVRLVKGREYVQKVMSDACMIKPSSDKDKPKEETPVLDTAPASETTIDDERICKICYENERNICFVPCGHVIACASCALSTTTCPMCRRPFTTAVRLYYS